MEKPKRERNKQMGIAFEIIALVLLALVALGVFMCAYNTNATCDFLKKIEHLIVDETEKP